MPIAHLLRAGGQVVYMINNGDDMTAALSRGSTQPGYLTV